jgi:hypothetical protein
MMHQYGIRIQESFPLSFISHNTFFEVQYETSSKKKIGEGELNIVQLVNSGDRKGQEAFTHRTCLNTITKNCHYVVRISGV